MLRKNVTEIRERQHKAAFPHAEQTCWVNWEMLPLGYSRPNAQCSQCLANNRISTNVHKSFLSNWVLIGSRDGGRGRSFISHKGLKRASPAISSMHLLRRKVSWNIHSSFTMCFLFYLVSSNTREFFQAYVFLDSWTVLSIHPFKKIFAYFKQVIAKSYF